MRRGRESGTAQHGEEKAQWDLIHDHKSLNGGCRNDRGKLCSVVPSARSRDSGHNLGNSEKLTSLLLTYSLTDVIRQYFSLLSH